MLSARCTAGARAHDYPRHETRNGEQQVQPLVERRAREVEDQQRPLQQDATCAHAREKGSRRQPKLPHTLAYDMGPSRRPRDRQDGGACGCTAPRSRVEHASGVGPQVREPAHLTETSKAEENVVQARREVREPAGTRRVVQPTESAGWGSRYAPEKDVL